MDMVICFTCLGTKPYRTIVEMSGNNVDGDYLYNLPSGVLNDFTRVMDSLSESDWLRFASCVIPNQTELRLVEQRRSRTDSLMNIWGNRNGTVGELLSLLQDLEMFRARDIILKWKNTQQCSPPCNTPTLLQSASTHSDSLSLFTPSNKKPLPFPDSAILPKPDPPPSHMKSEEKTEKHTQQPIPSKDPTTLPASAMCWSHEEVLRGTDNFALARCIGEGGFGHVYRAKMRNTDFAVKKLKEDSHIGWTVVKESFMTEVEKLSQYRHPNILDFAGYSIEGGTYCLLYIYMPRGSLEDRLHCQDSAALSWPQRISVLQGSARAIQFLHSCTPKLIHGDIKSANILLGEHLEPKLGDFGLARLCQSPRAAGKTTTIAQTKTVRGTLAYLPEEDLRSGQLGVELDVYSYGVVLLEVLTGRRAFEVDSNSKAVYLKDLVSEAEDDGLSCSNMKHSRELSLSHAADHICKKHLDPKVTSKGMPPPHGSLEISQLACHCLDRRKKRRPPMTEVFEKLDKLHLGLKASGRSAVVGVSPVPTPSSLSQSLPSEDPSVLSLTHRLCELGLQDDACCCLPDTGSPTRSQGPVSDGDPGTRGAGSSSSLMPCESDENQGFSQYVCPVQKNPPLPCGTPGAENRRSCGPLRTMSSQGSAASDGSNQQIHVNPIRERLVQKMVLYEEGKINSSDLLSSPAQSYGGMIVQSREPEESDEFL